jgi:uncharacterized protein YecT (DUF1311 family)
MSNCAKFLNSALVVLAFVGTASAKDHPHVADADREYAAVLSHPEYPCAQESTNLGYSQCMTKELEFTEEHLNAFLISVRAILADGDGTPADTQPTGKVKQLDILNNTDRAWREYKKNLCELAFAGFEGGSGTGPAQTECEYRADRQYVKDVADAILLKTLAK